jgi:DNA-binding NtrC family response regulator
MARKMRSPKLVQKKDKRFPAGEPSERGDRKQPERAAAAGLFRNEILELFVEFVCQGRPLLIKELIESLEKRIILRTLISVAGNQKEAARALGIKYTTLYEKVKRYDIRFKKIPDKDSWPPFTLPPWRPGDSSF